MIGRDIPQVTLKTREVQGGFLRKTRRTSAPAFRCFVIARARVRVIGEDMSVDEFSERVHEDRANASSEINGFQIFTVSSSFAVFFIFLITGVYENESPSTSGTTATTGRCTT